MPKKHVINHLVSFAILCLSSTAFALPVTIDFESIPDSTDVGSYYHSYGVDFQSAISLTAGFSLNELDFPPHSGVRVIGDNVFNNGDPMTLNFVNPVSSLSAYFAYGSQLTFSAFDAGNSLLGTMTSASSHIGSDQLISLPWTGISTLKISGATANSFILDDLSFNAQPTSVPDAGSTLGLLAAGMAAVLAQFRRQNRVSQSIKNNL